MRQFTILLLFIALSISAFSQRRLDKQNFAELYNINGIDLHPTFQIYHNSDTASTLFYKIDNSELKYKLGKDSILTAKASIHYKVYYSYKAKHLVDSSTFIYTDSENYGLNNSSYGYINIPLKKGYQYLLYIEYKDINSDYLVKKLLDIDKTNKLSSQNFYIKAPDDLPYLRNYINKNENFIIVSERNDIAQINLHVFKPNILIPKPPMVEDNKQIEGLRADTLYKLNINNGISNELKLTDQGFYHFYSNSKNNEGYTVYRFTNQYPYITTPMQMIMPLRYISSSSEFSDLYKSKNKKEAVEKFWIKISGDENRAKSLIKLYYNRVQNANINFTADREGWMTDRGMIYIIYGTPDVVYRDQYMETWQYGNYKNNKAISFNFYKVNNPFSRNLYEMQRNEEYKYSWMKAVGIWRK